MLEVLHTGPSDDGRVFWARGNLSGIEKFTPAVEDDWTFDWLEPAGVSGAVLRPGVGKIWMANQETKEEAEMMQELVQKLSEKTGMSPDKAQEAVNVVVSHLKERLPAPLASGLDRYLEGGSVEDELKAAAAGLGGVFGKTNE